MSQALKRVQNHVEKGSPYSDTLRTSDQHNEITHHMRAGLRRFARTINSLYLTIIMAAIAPAAQSSGLWVANSDTGTIGAYNTSGGLSIVSIISNLGTAYALAIDSNDNLYTASLSTGVIGKYNANTGSAINANLIRGLNNPIGLAIDSSGVLYVACQGDNTVRTFNSTTGALINGNLISGLSNLVGIALDSSGKVFTLDSGNNRIGKYDPVSGAGIPNFITGLSNPRSIATFDDPGSPSIPTIFVSNIGNNTVVKYNSSTGAQILPYTIAAPAAAGSFGLTIDSQNYLYISSNTNNTISKYTATGTATPGALAPGFTTVTGLTGARGLAVSNSSNAGPGSSAAAPAPTLTEWGYFMLALLAATMLIQKHRVNSRRGSTHHQDSAL